MNISMKQQDKNRKSIFTKDGYFNLEGWFEKYNINYLKDNKMVVLTSPRNNGKSTSSWKFIINEIWKKSNYEMKVAFARENKEKMDKALATFKSQYSNEYLVDKESGIIFLKEFEKDEKNKDVLKKNLKEIGRFVNVKNEFNYRSQGENAFNGYSFLFYDEFNETKQQIKGFFQNLIMLISTIERFNKPFITLLLGNKIYANNDVFIKFNLNTNRINYGKDFFQNVNNDVYYIDVGSETYEQKLENKNTLANRLAKYDHKTNRLFNVGGFLEGTFYNVLNPLNFKNKNIKYYFQFKDYMLEYGKCEIENKEYYYLQEIFNYENKNINIIALDVLAYSKNGFKVDKKSLIEISDILYEQLQNKKLMFSSFDLMNDFEKWILLTTSMFD